METETETKTETTTPAQPAAPVTPAAPTDAKPVEKTQTQTVEKPQTDSKEFARQAFRDREQKRTEKQAETQRIADLERKAKDYDALLAKQNEIKTPPSFLDDPDGWAKGVEERAHQRAVEALQQREAAYSYRQNANQAAEWLLTRSHLKEDKSLIDETAKILETNYPEVSAINPAAAARLAYLDVCAMKGIAPDIDGFKGGTFNATKGRASADVRPTAPAGGKKVWSRGEADKYVMSAAPGTKDFNDRMTEVEEANKEGRIK